VSGGRRRDVSGFTLIEVVIALVITSVVALLVYGTLGAAFDAREQLGRHQRDDEARTILRALLVNALRHPVEEGGSAMNESLFRIEPRVDARGTRSDVVSFVSRGVTSPLGATSSWTVTVGETGDGLRVVATPTDPTSEQAPVEILVDEVRGLRARALDRFPGASWSDAWESAGRVPVAVAIDLLRADGTRIGAPLVVYSALERAP
jgi:type II secretion system protein J